MSDSNSKANTKMNRREAIKAAGVVAASTVAVASTLGSSAAVAAD